MKLHFSRALRAHHLLLCLLLTTGTLSAQPFNALNFDGVDDRMTVPISGTTLDDATTFQIEFWFRAAVENPLPDCPSGPRGIASLAGDVARRVGIGICDGEVRGYFSSQFQQIPPTEIIIGPATPGQWQVLRIAYFDGDMSFSLDCAPAVIQSYALGLLTLPPAPMAGLRGFSVGGDLAAAQVPNSTHFLGEIDQLQMFDRLGRAVPGGTCLTEYCVPDPLTSGAIFYYDFNQEGAAAGAMGGIGAVENRALTPGGNSNLVGFDLTDFTTVFVPSGAPLLGEGLTDLPFEIRDYPNRNAVLSEICSGEPVHFCLGPNGPPASLMSQATIVWEFSDDGGTTWADLLAPPFTDYCFPVLPGVLTVNCTMNTDGFVDRQFRARMTVEDATLGQSCTYYSETNTLRIRCPLTDVAVALSPNEPACAGDVIDFNVGLMTSHLWLMPLGPDTEITWTMTGPGGLGALGEDDMIAFNVQFTAPALAQTAEYCFVADITDCNGSSSFSACISVDPEPEAGTIIGLPFTNPRNLILVTASPNPVYAICPGEDATLGEGIGSQNCRTQWQYTFNDPQTVAMPDWVDLGTTNTVQNTNILPSHLWPNGTTSIYYRYRCDPLSDLSGCEPDYSDIAEIRLIAPPYPISLTGPDTYCFGNFVSIDFVESAQGGSVTYEWFLDGALINHMGTSYVDFRGRNYQIIADNGCFRVPGPVFTNEECYVVPDISCPLQPNNCVNPGDDVTVSAAGSTYTCDDGAALSYEWFVDNVPAGTGETLTYTSNPSTNPLIPTSILLRVTSPGNCSDTLSRVIMPCGNQW